MLEYKRQTRNGGAVRLAVLAVCFATSCNQANALFLNGNNLHNACQREPFAAGVYVAGVVDTLLSTQQARFCTPPNVTGEQAKDIVCRGLANKPAVRTVDASFLTHTFLIEAFPCQ